MILVNLDLTLGAKLAQTTTVVQGSDEPVSLVLSSAPGTISGIYAVLGTDAAPPSILAYTDAFEEENSTTYNALMDLTDTRLAAFMTGKGNTSVNLQVGAVIDGALKIFPNCPVTVQPNIVAGSTSSLGAPTYYTETQTNAAIAAAVLGLGPAPFQADLTPAAGVTAALFAATNFATLRRKIIPGAGSGAYTATYTLPDTSMTTGAFVHVNVEMPTSANPTVTISDGASTVLATINDASKPTPGAAAFWYGLFYFDGTAWHCVFRAFNL